MIKIVVPNEETMEALIEESRYIHCSNLDSDFCNTLMHLHLLPEEAWIIGEVDENE